MLAPETRAVLLEALRPPLDYRVDRVVATTYTLDLTALLIAPLAFSLFDAEASHASEQRVAAGMAEAIDPLAMLKSVREQADRLSVFCQATRIAYPGKYRQLLTYLEDSLVEVQPQRDRGIFHPKLWVLRLVPEQPDDGDDEAPVLYRVLVLSRNLTFDRSWDTMLVLDGELVERKTGIASNRPLADFVAALPALALRPPSERIAQDVALVADELRRVRFEMPEGFDELRFHPLGIEGYRAFPFDERITRMLVVSPFVTGGMLRRLSEPGHQDVLVSRPEALAPLTQQAAGGPVGQGALDAFETLHVLHDAADSTEARDDDVEPQATAQDTPEGETWPPARGLHAKLYVADDGHRAHVWTGSANATDAAFQHNVEFLVQLTGSKRRVGVEAFLNGPHGNNGLLALLTEFQAPPVAEAPDPALLRLKARLQEARQAIARIRWRALVGAPQAIDGGAADALGYPFALHAHGDGVVLPPDVQVRCWPIALRDTFAQRLVEGRPGLAANFGVRSFEALTAFFAFHVQASEGALAAEEHFVINVPLEGAPADRGARLLQSLLSDAQKVARFLRMLLETEPELSLLEGLAGAHGSTTGQAGGSHEAPLLEELLRTLATHPARLDAVERVVSELMSTAEGAARLPQGFEEIWGAIRAVRATGVGR